jgi:peptidoglycan/LPS O-acetylase OafA/YrhL
MNNSPPEKGVSANLDLLRTVAVLLVLAQHLCRRMYIDQVAWMQTSWGYFGVLLFFVHTCLVLMSSMERTELLGWPLVKNFAIRRVFRIYPLSVLTVVAALSLHLDSDINGIRGLSHGPFPGVLGAVSNLLLVQNLTHSESIVNVLWSLPLELQMYVFLPLLFLWIRRKNMTWPLLGLWATSVIVALAELHLAGASGLSILLFVPCFLPGVIAYSLPYRPRIGSVWWLAFILLLILLFTLRPVLSTGWILCLALGVMIPQFKEIRSYGVRWVSNRVATYSYGIYLSHQFCIWLALGVLAAWPLFLKIPLLILMLIALPVLLYHAVERPMIRVGSRLAARFAGPQVMVGETDPSKIILREEVAP